MEGRVIAAKMIAEFEEHLILEERSVATMDEYVAFMKKYSDNPSDVGLLADYTKYMSKYADMVEKFDKWESEDLNDAELAYYIDVQARVSKKLLEVAG